MSSTDLVPSANDLAASFLDTAFKAIESASVNQRIDDHYFRLAKKLYRRAWRRCGRATGHDATDNSGVYSSYPQYVCRHCGKPGGHSRKNREKKGIAALAARLREADRAARMEWTP